MKLLNTSEYRLMKLNMVIPHHAINPTALQICWPFYGLRSYVALETLCMLYYTLVCSKILYGTIVRAQQLIKYLLDLSELN